MDLFRRVETAQVDRLVAPPGLSPPRDDVLLYLMEGASSGQRPVYCASVPRALISPFDAAYDPSRHPIGESAIQATMTAWQSGRFTAVWVYPRGDRYILSDDYIVWAAAERGKPDFLPCWVLGEPVLPGCEDVKGPLDIAQVRSLLGLA